MVVSKVSTQNHINDHEIQLQELRKTLPDGPWKKEPHRVEFKHLGLQCLLSRCPLFSWCGYVGVPPEHPAYGKDNLGDEIDVHGGLTYADHCGGHICHIPSAGEPDELFWFGFDCGHAYDISPKMLLLHSGNPYREEVYRDMNYVRAETEKLAIKKSCLYPDKEN